MARFGFQDVTRKSSRFAQPAKRFTKGFAQSHQPTTVAKSVAANKLVLVNDAPIGIFDSGVGGLTVARAIIDQLPNESIIYVGDTANSASPFPVLRVLKIELVVQ